MENLKSIIRAARKKQGLLIRDVAASLGIDAALISRYEKGERLPAKQHLPKLSEVLNVKPAILTKYWLAEKILEQIKEYPEATEALSLAEESMAEYKVAAKKNLSYEIKNELKAADALKAGIRKFYPINKTQLKKLEEYFATGYTFESNRIEGNTLSLQETALVVNKGITISGKTMKEHLEAINHAEALEYVQEIAKGKTDISERLIKELHYLVLKSIDKENAGQYRRTDVRITGSEHKPAAHYDVPAEMEKLIEYYYANSGRLHPVLLAADMHWMLAGIHPFIDGNGRTSRLLMNLILIRNGYVIANLKGDLQSRLGYYKTLEEAQVKLQTVPFRELVLKTVIEGLEEYKSML